MSQKSLAQWLGILYLPPHWLYPTWPLLRGYEPNGIVGLGSSPPREFLILVHDCSVRAEKSFRVNPSSLVNSGAVVRQICAAKLSNIGAFSTRCCPSYSNHTYERGIFLRKISCPNTIRYVRKSSIVLLAPEGA